MIPTSDPARTSTPSFMKRPVTKVIPTMHSAVATTSSAVWPDSIPNDSRCIVRSARSAAGLAPGKNFNTPKARNTNPRQTRRIATL